MGNQQRCCHHVVRIQVGESASVHAQECSCTCVGARGNVHLWLFQSLSISFNPFQSLSISFLFFPLYFFSLRTCDQIPVTTQKRSSNEKHAPPPSFKFPSLVSLFFKTSVFCYDRASFIAIATGYITVVFYGWRKIIFTQNG
ncbi:hypothetical protein POVWA2_060730 [Plasmodium ovale wallikeri]|uniref:Uncharacterized protein n=1 Tax=Plasmodium ovale wallikeri TaxID=864142 RepID=A0A1A8YRW6_PLAOA|nr:hypothetical protein POVWA1_020920 [Plasmodium ovale wallikeri]SBT50651.1 hypothetical protein POVWA2_060730 [Plasmodium ovale wallikeri]